MNDRVQIEIILDKDCEIIIENDTHDLPDPMDENYDTIEDVECYSPDNEYNIIELDREFMEKTNLLIHNNNSNIENKSISDLNFFLDENIENKSCLKNILEKKIRNIIDEDSIINQIENTIDENINTQIKENR